MTTLRARWVLIVAVLVLVSACSRCGSTPVAPPKAARPAVVKPAAPVDERMTPDPRISFVDVKAGPGPERAGPGMMVETWVRVLQADGGLVYESDRKLEPLRFIIGKRGPDRIFDELARGMTPQSTRRAVVPEGFELARRDAGDVVELEVTGIEYIIEP